MPCKPPALWLPFPLPLLLGAGAGREAAMSARVTVCWASQSPYGFLLAYLCFICNQHTRLMHPVAQTSTVNKALS